MKKYRLLKEDPNAHIGDIFIDCGGKLHGRRVYARENWLMGLKDEANVATIHGTFVGIYEYADIVENTPDTWEEVVEDALIHEGGGGAGDRVLFINVAKNETNRYDGVDWKLIKDTTPTN